ncbi:MAG: TolC family protein [Bacteroidota bacterium]|nr:TolC family protein [Bacteroidota bacterium]
MYKNYRRYVIACIFLAAVSAHASELTLHDAVSEALQANKDFQAAVLNKKIAQGDVTSAGLLANPSLNLIGDVLPSSGEHFSPEEKYYGASLAMPIDLAGHRGKKIDFAERTAEVVHNQVADFARQLRRQVQITYYNALALHDRYELAKTNLNRLNSFVDLTRLRAEKKEVPVVDVTRADLVRLQYDADVQQLLINYHSALIDLQVLMGRTVYDDSLQLRSSLDELTAEPVRSPEEAVSFAMTRRPDFLALQKQIEVEKANQQLQQSYSGIDMSISGDYSNQQFTKFYGVSLNFTLPIFNRNQGEREKSEARIEQAQFALASVQNSMNAEIRRTYEEMNSLRTLVQEQKTTVLPHAEEVLKSVELAYRLGNTTLLDFLDAQRSFTETRISYIDAQLRYQISRINFSNAIVQEEIL